MIRSAVGASGATEWLANDRGGSRLPPGAEAKGSLRAVLAALRNLEHLLRSPRVGPRALAQVIPELRDLCLPLSTSADSIRQHFGTSVYEQGAARELSEFLRNACIRLETVLSWAAQAAMDAKSRLSFEAQIGILTGELTTARGLLDMLTHAAERAYTDLDLGEVVQEALSISSRRDGFRDPGIQVVADLPLGVHAFQASAQVIVPLVALATSWVRSGGECQDALSKPPSAAASTGSVGRISVEAVRDSAHSVMIVVSRAPLEGDVHVVHPPVLIAPALACAESSARIGGGAFVAHPERVTIRWPSRAIAENTDDARPVRAQIAPE